jgi:hypothetical protein
MKKAEIKVVDPFGSEPKVVIEKGSSSGFSLDDLERVQRTYFKPYYFTSDEDQENESEEEIPRTIRKARTYGIKNEKTINPLYKKYIDSNDLIYLYKILFKELSYRLDHSYNYNPLNPRNDVERRIQLDVDDILADFQVNKIELTEELQANLIHIITSLYESPIESKSFWINLYNMIDFTEVISKCIDKGVRIDPEISDNLITFDFNKLKESGGCVCLCYIPSGNQILWIKANLHDGSYHQVELIKTIKFLNKLSSINKPKDNVKEATIEIDGKLYNKRIFESLVESKYENFIMNLNLETLLDTGSTENAEDAVENNEPL